MEVYTNNNTGSNIFTKSGTFFNNSMDVTVNIGNNVLGFGVVYSGRTLINYTLIPLVTCVGMVTDRIHKNMKQEPTAIV